MQTKKDPTVVLKPGRDIHLKNRHPWVFMGAVASLPEFTNGDLLPVCDSAGNLVGHGYFHAGQSIVGRMVNFSDEDPVVSIKRSICSAVELRKLVISKNTTAYRVINGEGDNLPGLIVDVYGDILVLQINTLGMERLKSLLVTELRELLSPTAVFEKSNSATRKKEGLPPTLGWVDGSAAEDLTIEEHGLLFAVNLARGQKTGFFLDQREERQLVRTYAKDRTVLNCFGYSGGFTVYALAGGAELVDTADTDEDALRLAQQNVELNGFSQERHRVVAEDIFTYLRNTTNLYDFIILDPPAFAKKASDVQNASRGYRELNRLALEKLQKGGLLLTASCSSHIDAAAFQTIVFQALKDSGKGGKIISTHQLAGDHPVNIFFPEGNYLKSLLLAID